MFWLQKEKFMMNSGAMERFSRQKKILFPQRDHGGAALEYILVTTFAAIIGIAALAFTGKAIKEQLKKLGENLGVEGEPEIDLPFGNGG